MLFRSKLFENNRNEIAAVIMEPVTIQMPDSGYLEAVRDLAHKNGALLIFDEIVTGFRFAIGGAQEYFNVIPDLACFGKGIANGYPLSVLVGRKDVMALLDEVFFSFTFGGELLSIRAALETIKIMKKEPVFKHMRELGTYLKDNFNRKVQELGAETFIQCMGLPERSTLCFNSFNGISSVVLKSLFQQEVIKRGVLFNGNHFISYSHTMEDIKRTLTIYKEALEILITAITKKDAESLLVGEAVTPVFQPV